VPNRILEKLKNEGLTPSFSLLVVKNGVTELSLEYNASVSKTIYDVASLTKPLVTFPIVKKHLQLTNRLSLYFPNLPKEIGKLTVKQLITHTSGFIPWLPLYHYKKPYLTTIFEKGFSAKQNIKTYSCLNYIILKSLVTKYAKMPYKTIASNFLSKFSNCYIEPIYTKNVKPTENGNRFEFELSKKFIEKPNKKLYRFGKIICGEVHDLNAYYDNGFSGNSGLFATAEGIKNLIHNLFSYSDFYLPLFEKEKYYYHMGFTGTGFAVSKRENIFVIFLSNRVHPKVKNINFSEIRHQIFEEALNIFL
jgi:CubicO group peptidase (beta-lactamase class C family)